MGKRRVECRRLATAASERSSTAQAASKCACSIAAAAAETEYLRRAGHKSTITQFVELRPGLLNPYLHSSQCYRPELIILTLAMRYWFASTPKASARCLASVSTTVSTC